VLEVTASDVTLLSASRDGRALSSVGLPAPGGETTAALEEGRAGGCWGVLEVTALDVTLLSASPDGRALSSDDRVIGC
jgi:hypothetical protein